MSDTKNSKPNKIVSFTKMLLITLVLMLLMGEFVTRVVLGVKPYGKEIPKPPYNTAQKDQTLGWKMTPNYSYTGEMEDVRGNSYPVQLNYDENGFKSYGDVNSSKPKVLFIGDSYTASIEVSNDKSFFNIIKDSLDIEVFAYGQAGFGTLQELLVLEQYLPIIKPDLVLWQTCANDFIDNSHELEMLSGYKVGERRPYITPNGEIEYIQPVEKLSSWGEYSSFFKFIDDKWSNFSYNTLQKDREIAEHYISTEKEKYAPYSRAIQLTQLIMKRAKATLPSDLRVVGYSADTYDPQMSDFKSIFEDEGFEYSIQSAEMIKNAQWSNQVVNSSDKYHWNEKGHRLVAEGLIKDVFEK